jgi:DNA-binding response OmpR family regulator
MGEADGWVYVVDDDLSMREALSSLARSRGWRAKTFESAGAFLEYARPRGPSCLILDVHLPGLTGPELQRQLERTRDAIPIIYITGNGDVPTAVRAMKSGAVEFLTKPFEHQALIGAIQHCLARWPRQQSQPDQANAASRLLEFGLFRLDVSEECLWRCVGPQPQRVILTPKEFTLLRYLAERPGRLVTEEELLHAVWPKVCVQPEAVKSRLYEIRKTLGDSPRAPRFIETVHRRGYRFIAPVRHVTMAADSLVQESSLHTGPVGRDLAPGMSPERAGKVTLNIPERVAQAVEALWNEALADARESFERRESADNGKI